MSKKLGDFITLISGQDLTKEKYNDRNIGIPYIMGASNMNNGTLSIERWTDIATVVGKKGDLIISVKGTIGELLILEEEEVHLSRQVMAIRTNEKIDTKFIFYYIKNSLSKIKEKAKGMIPGITREDILGIKYEEICISKQKRIVEVLDKSQGLINNRNEQIKILDELVKSRFIEMFGNLYTNDKNWDESIVSQYCQVKGGKRLPKGERLLDEQTEHPYLRVLDLKNSTVLEDDIKYLTDDIYEKIKRYTISSDDVYLTNVGEKLGMAGTIPEKFNNANLTENAVKLVFDNSIINKVYFAYYLNSDVCQKYILERKMSVGVPKLAIFRIESLPLILPPAELQNEFDSFIKQVDKLKFEMEASLKELENNFNSLMQRAFNGEL